MSEGLKVFKIRRMTLVVTLLMAGLTVATCMLFKSEVFGGWVMLLALLLTMFSLVAAITANIFDYYTEGYECDKCGQKFIPTNSRSTGFVHPFKSKRLVRCNNCKKYEWHSRK